MARRPKRVFYAYPSSPHDLVSTINMAADMVRAIGPHVELKTWPQMEIFGAIVSERVTSSIDEADVLYCDITVPNQNVYYEFGYAIGCGKSVGVTINFAFEGAIKEAQSDGLFDTIGYRQYENSNQLADIIASPPSTVLIDLYTKELNRSQPIFLLDAVRKTDFRNYIVSAIKESKNFYRSFDPVEVPRFGSTSMIAEVTSSTGVVVPFIAPHIEDAKRHNLRASFLAGLSQGLKRTTLLIEQSHSNGTPPIDFRERVKSVRSSEEISTAVAEFAKEAAADEKVLRRATVSNIARNPLQRLTLGASAAENEFRTLQNYFVQTSEYLRCTRGELNVVAGRKGSGKTAIFFQVRDAVRRDKNSIVIDLKPESHQLSLFREEMLRVADAGIFDHTISALWYFLILTEILLIIQENLQRSSRFAADVTEKLEKIDTICRKFQISQSGDFTFRITKLSNALLKEIKRTKITDQGVAPQSITNLVFAGGISELRCLIEELTDSQSEIWFLFDNIDKGWPATGLDPFDVRMVRLLVEALSKTGRDFHNIRRRFIPIVFVRNDVLELMVSVTPDRNKWAQVSIDWSDRPKIKQVIYERLRGSSADKTASFDRLWAKHFCENVAGQPTFEYFVDHCLMRPRFLINILEYAISNAINRGNQTVFEQDCIDAVRQHANYLIDDFGYEIRDISGLSSDILYSLLGISKMETREEIIQRFRQFKIEEEQLDKAFGLMLWYGIVGVATDESAGKFIYDFDYNLRRLDAEIRKAGDNVLFVTNPAVQVALCS